MYIVSFIIYEFMSFVITVYTLHKYIVDITSCSLTGGGGISRTAEGFFCSSAICLSNFIAFYGP